MILIGRPSDLYDIQNDDWAPTLKLGHNKQQTITSGSDGAQQNEQTTMENNNEQQQITDHADSRPQQLEPEEKAQQLPCAVVDPVVFDDEPTFDINNEISCQTDLIISDVNGIEQDDQNLRSELYELRSKAMNSKLNEQSFKDNEEKVKYYTGLPNFLVLMQVFHLCENYVSTTSQSALGKFEQFILVLMRLRLNLLLQDLVYRFGISQPTVSRIWHKWIHVLYKRTQFLIQWPERDILQTTMPMEFRKSFGTKVVVIIDCFECLLKDLLIFWLELRHGRNINAIIRSSL